MRIASTYSPTATALSVAGLFLVLGLTGCAGSWTASPGDEGRATATTFLDEIQAGRVEPAWRSASVEFKSLMGVGSLNDYVRTHPALKGKAEFIEGPKVVKDRPGLAEYVFKATAPANTKSRGKVKAGATSTSPATIRVTTAQEEGVSKVERLTIE